VIEELVPDELVPPLDEASVDVARSQTLAKLRSLYEQGGTR
jgi:hypothetical protein